MKLGLLLFIVTLSVLVSGCINANVTNKLNRDGSSDINISIKSDYNYILSAVQSSLENSELAIEKAVLTEEGNEITYSWKNVFLGMQGVTNQSNVDIPINKWNFESKLKFPYYVTTLTFNNIKTNYSKLQQNELTQSISTSYKINYDLEIYGDVKDTNGVKLSNNKVRFDLTKNKSYYVTFNDFFLSTWIDSMFSKLCVPEWECSEWSTCHNNIKTRKCVQKNKCNYLTNPLEEESCETTLTTTTTPTTTTISPQKRMEDYENQYLQTAVEVNKNYTEVSSNGKFTVTVIRAGNFKHLKYDTWGDEITNFRIDLKVKNSGKYRGQFYTSDSLLIDDSNNQYDALYESTINPGYMESNVTKEGYLIFDSIGDSVKTVKLVIYNGYPVDKEGDYPLSYSFKTKYEFNFNLR